MCQIDTTPTYIVKGAHLVSGAGAGARDQNGGGEGRGREEALGNGGALAVAHVDNNKVVILTSSERAVERVGSPAGLVPQARLDLEHSVGVGAAVLHLLPNTVVVVVLAIESLRSGLKHREKSNNTT